MNGAVNSANKARFIAYGFGLAAFHTGAGCPYKSKADWELAAEWQKGFDWSKSYAASKPV